MAYHFAKRVGTTQRALERRKVLQTTLVTSLVFFVATTGLAVQDNDGHLAEAATAKVLDTENAWKLEKQLVWDQDLRIVHFLIRSDIRVDNVTGDLIQGSITDLNGTVLNIYGEESVILARFGYDSGTRSDWEIVTKPSKGLFSFDIPSRYSDADYVKLWVNPNNSEESYYQLGTEITVNDGIFVMRGAPPLSFVDVSSGEGLDLQECPGYQSQIKAKVTSAWAEYNLSG